MSIASGFTKMKNYILTSKGYKLLSRWTSSQTVHMGDGTDDTDTVENRFGAMKGITSSLATDNDEYALSASAGKNLQDQCTQLNQSLHALNEGIENLSTKTAIAVEFSGTTDSTGDLRMPNEYSFKNGYYIQNAYLYQDNMVCIPFHGVEPNYLHITNLSGSPVPNTAFSGITYFKRK